MRKTKVKVPAKINLTLDVIDKKNGFHNIKSLVTSVNIYDTIKVIRRVDNQVRLHTNFDCGCEENENNAYKAGKLFRDKFNTRGADIYLKKSIPLASGLGGSSADIAGVLLCMKRLYKESGDIYSLANELGSDSAYMLKGGLSIISGKGGEILPINGNVKLFAIILTCDDKMSAKEGYEGFDKQKIQYPSVSFEAVSHLVNLRNEFFEIIKNDLQPYVQSVMPSIESRIKDLDEVGSKRSLMTGSGSAVFGLFTSIRERNKAYRKLKVKYNGYIYKCITL